MHFSFAVKKLNPACKRRFILVYFFIKRVYHIFGIEDRGNAVLNEFVLALDQGTTSSRAIVFNKAGEIVSVGQYPYEQIYPQPGWV